MSEPRRTPLYDTHVAAGGRIVDFAGWALPVQYESIVAEHQAVRSAAGLFDVSHMGEVEISGPGADATAGRLFSSDVAALPVGRARYALMTNERGGVVDDVIVYRLASDRLLVVVNAANRDKDFEWMCRHGLEATEIIDRSDEYALLALQGPKALSVLERVAPELAQALVRGERFDVLEGDVGGTHAIVARTGYTGEDGVELFLPPAAAPSVWATLMDAGADAGLRPVGLGARDTLRLEAAMPLYGHEIDDDTSPFEARLGWAVDTDRDDLIGAAALREAKARPRSRRLVGLNVEGGIARDGHEVVDGDDRVVGRVSSGTRGPTVGRAIALAFVAEPLPEGLAVVVRGKRRPASVTKLPFYVTQRPKLDA